MTSRADLTPRERAEALAGRFISQSLDPGDILKRRDAWQQEIEAVILAAERAAFERAAEIADEYGCNEPGCDIHEPQIIARRLRARACRARQGGGTEMSRSGYVDDWDGDSQWILIRWRGAVASAVRGKRGQAFLREMLSALDRLECGNRLIADRLEEGGEVCALGAVGMARELDMSGVDPEDRHAVADFFGIPHALACEIMYMNDEGGPYNQTPEARHTRMRKWIEHLLSGGKP